jgi:hypothetical protein
MPVSRAVASETEPCSVSNHTASVSTPVAIRVWLSLVSVLGHEPKPHGAGLDQHGLLPFAAVARHLREPSAAQAQQRLPSMT